MVRTRDQIVDELLVLAAQTGRSGAFGQLAERWHNRLLRHARRLVGDPDGAAEAVQEAWIAMARGLRTLKDPACYGAWALRITTRRCADWIARRQRERSRHADLDPDEHGCDPDDEEIGRRATARKLLAGLDPDQRFLLTLFYLEDLSVAEVARVLGIPAGTVKSRLFHARTKLRAGLEARNDTHGRGR